MDATKGTLGTIEKGEGATGGYISQKEQTNIPYTCTDNLLYTQHCGGKCHFFFLASLLPSFFMGRVLHKRECRRGGNRIVFFFKCSQLHMLIALTWILLRRCDFACNLFVFHLIFVTMGSYNMFSVCSVKSLGKPSFLQRRGAFFSFHLALFKAKWILRILKQSELIFWTWLCYCSVAKSFPTLCDPRNCSRLGFLVLDYLLDFA